MQNIFFILNLFKYYSMEISILRHEILIIFQMSLKRVFWNNYQILMIQLMILLYNTIYQQMKGEQLKPYDATNFQQKQVEDFSHLDLLPSRIAYSQGEQSIAASYALSYIAFNKQLNSLIKISKEQLDYSIKFKDAPGRVSLHLPQGEISKKDFQKALSKEIIKYFKANIDRITSHNSLITKTILELLVKKSQSTIESSVNNYISLPPQKQFFQSLKLWNKKMPSINILFFYNQKIQQLQCFDGKEVYLKNLIEQGSSKIQFKTFYKDISQLYKDRQIDYEEKLPYKILTKMKEFSVGFFRRQNQQSQNFKFGIDLIQDNLPINFNRLQDRQGMDLIYNEEEYRFIVSLLDQNTDYTDYLNFYTFIKEKYITLENILKIMVSYKEDLQDKGCCFLIYLRLFQKYHNYFKDHFQEALKAKKSDQNSQYRIFVSMFDGIFQSLCIDNDHKYPTQTFTAFIFKDYLQLKKFQYYTFGNQISFNTLYQMIKADRNKQMIITLSYQGSFAVYFPNMQQCIIKNKNHFEVRPLKQIEWINKNRYEQNNFTEEQRKLMIFGGKINQFNYQFEFKNLLNRNDYFPKDNANNYEIKYQSEKKDIDQFDVSYLSYLIGEEITAPLKTNQHNNKQTQIYDNFQGDLIKIKTIDFLKYQKFVMLQLQEITLYKLVINTITQVNKPNNLNAELFFLTLYSFFINGDYRFLLRKVFLKNEKYIWIKDYHLGKRKIHIIRVKELLWKLLRRQQIQPQHVLTRILKDQIINFCERFSCQSKTEKEQQIQQGQSGVGKKIAEFDKMYAIIHTIMQNFCDYEIFLIEIDRVPSITFLKNMFQRFQQQIQRSSPQYLQNQYFFLFICQNEAFIINHYQNKEFILKRVDRNRFVQLGYQQLFRKLIRKRKDKSYQQNWIQIYIVYTPYELASSQEKKYLSIKSHIQESVQYAKDASEMDFNAQLYRINQKKTRISQSYFLDFEMFDQEREMERLEDFIRQDSYLIRHKNITWNKLIYQINQVKLGFAKRFLQVGNQKQYYNCVVITILNILKDFKLLQQSFQIDLTNYLLKFEYYDLKCNLNGNIQHKKEMTQGIKKNFYENIKVLKSQRLDGKVWMSLFKKIVVFMFQKLLNDGDKGFLSYQVCRVFFGQRYSSIMIQFNSSLSKQCKNIVKQFLKKADQVNNTKDGFKFTLYHYQSHCNKLLDAQYYQPPEKQGKQRIPFETITQNLRLGLNLVSNHSQSHLMMEKCQNWAKDFLEHLKNKQIIKDWDKGQIVQNYCFKYKAE